MDEHKFIIDFHCHSRAEFSGDCIEIVSCDPIKNISGGFHTSGYHPWWHNDYLTAQELINIGKAYSENITCLAIGECGLDKLKGASEEIQTANFIKQIEIANRLNAPVIIHCVRKYNELISLFKRHAQTPWTVHGFSRNRILAKSLLDLGICLSVAPHHAMTFSMTDMLRYLPNDMFFLETDSDRRTSIRQRYALMAQIKSLDFEELADLVYENVCAFFGPKFINQ